MAKLTINVPDELAKRLKPLQNHLPELLWQLLDSHHLFGANQSEEKVHTPESSVVYQEILDFLIKRPTPTQISSFKVSPIAQERLQTLLRKNREGGITLTETAELDVYEQLEHLMILLKAKAYSAIN